MDACGSSGGLWAAWDASVNVVVVQLPVFDFEKWIISMLTGSSC